MQTSITARIAANDAVEEPPTENTSTTSPDKKKPRHDPEQNHGRYGFNDYSGCQTVTLAHKELKAGDHCPACAEQGSHSRLCLEKPGVVICLVGQPLITGIRYCVEKLRCLTCGERYEAEMPPDVSKGIKYAPSCHTNIAIGRYWLGLPFKRIELWQQMQGVPVPDATQWDKMEALWKIVEPVHKTLVELSAEADKYYYDDTPNHILALRNKEEGQAEKKRKGIYTTAIVSEVACHTLYLFITSEQYAGENMKKIMEKRSSKTDMITMSDASANNIPRGLNEKLLARWILCFCLVHSRRKFFEVCHFFDKECDFVLKILGEVYRHEHLCKKECYTPEQRLAYHQKHSTPLMEALRAWLGNKLLYDEVEANNGLGDAIQYMLRHWEALTKFLHVAGAPLDNSLCERTVKVAIRHRRNSLFFKTRRGAEIGDGLMSLIHTAARNNINAHDYLNNLQLHKEAVAAEPELWLPWHYKNTLQTMEETTLQKVV